MVPYAEAEVDTSLGRDKTGHSMDGKGSCGFAANIHVAVGVACLQMNQIVKFLCQEWKPISDTDVVTTSTSLVYQNDVLWVHKWRRFTA